MQVPYGGGSSIPGIGPGLGSAALDGPPPSPTAMGEVPGAFSMSGLAGALPNSMGGMPGSMPASGMPPQVLTGIQQSAQPVLQLFDAWTQVAPDQQGLLAMLKELVNMFLNNVGAAGGGPVSPTAAGPAFPGGGIDQGIAGPGTV